MLYKDGRLTLQNILKAMEEAKEAREKLKLFSPSEVVWDIEDLSKQLPWRDKSSTNITDLSNYFYTSGGKDMFEMLFKACDEALELEVDLEIETL
ncbi:Imm70 family immunity protein [Bacillus cereus]|uniref:Imm70 family immunity protein n=1 Tax=Bacillus cereus group TaxID=86661 RepID=UPI003D07461F